MSEYEKIYGKPRAEVIAGVPQAEPTDAPDDLRSDLQAVLDYLAAMAFGTKATGDVDTDPRSKIDAEKRKRDILNSVDEMTGY